MALLAAALAAAVAPAAARAVPAPDPEPGCLTQVVLPERRTLWAPPLDRPVSLRTPETPVRDALEAVARQARLELTYSAELLPGERRLCIALERVPVGAVLEALLAGSSLQPVVVGASQVVLAPTRAARPAVVAAVPAMARTVSALDRVVVTGAPDGAAQRGSPFALDVVTGEQLARFQAGSLAEALELAVPGVWSWTAPAGTVLARYGSIRGASSFAVSAPKVYIDGVEVANPLLVTQLDPARVERVEVIRGPQGAALYGADAISGVVQILTRHDGTAAGAPRVQLATAAGVANTAYAPRDAFVQDHALSLRVGNSARGLGAGLSAGTVGAVVPGAVERRALGDLSVRQTFARAVVTATARLALQAAGASTAPALAALAGVQPMGGPPGGLVRAFMGDSATGQRLAQYTVGTTVAFMPSLRWTHTVIGGVDGYALRGLSAVALAAPVTSASRLGEGQGAADRFSFRYRAVGRYDVAPATLLTLSVGAEQAVANEAYEVGGAVVDTRAPDDPAVAGAGGPVVTAPPVSLPSALRSSWSTNRGAWAQASLAIRETWFLSAGGRAERTTGATATPQQAAVPMVGVAWVHDRGGRLLKLRGAYGTGLRPARTLMRGSSWLGVAAASGMAALEPETQRGTEVGADLLLGEGLSLHATRFDQRAEGLIQPVAAVSSVLGGQGRVQRVMSYTLQNVGAIDNRGWELQARGRWQALTVSGMLSLVDSRVAATARGYRGELRPGDRMLDVPARTLSLAAGWQRGRVALHTGVAHAADWVTYDRATIAEALDAGEGRGRPLEGAQLRGFWARPTAVTRWRAGGTVRLTGALLLQVNGENLLDVQRGAPDDGAVIPGRTLTLGLRTQF